MFNILKYNIDMLNTVTHNIIYGKIYLVFYNCNYWFNYQYGANNNNKNILIYKTFICISIRNSIVIWFLLGNINYNTNLLKYSFKPKLFIDDFADSVYFLYIYANNFYSYKFQLAKFDKNFISIIGFINELNKYIKIDNILIFFWA